MKKKGIQRIREALVSLIAGVGDYLASVLYVPRVGEREGEVIDGRNRIRIPATEDSGDSYNEYLAVLKGIPQPGYKDNSTAR